MHMMGDTDADGDSYEATHVPEDGVVVYRNRSRARDDGGRR